MRTVLQSDTGRWAEYVKVDGVLILKELGKLSCNLGKKEVGIFMLIVVLYFR